jgi:uncharacterized protein (TIGR02271 family)
MGFLGVRSTLIPWELVREAENRLVVAADDSHVKDGPTFADDQEITPEFEEQVYSYYGLQRATGEHGQEGVGRDQSGSDLEDELRVQRTEEELRAGTREREAGQVSVRKRVRTDRERMEVPTRREEVTVERAPVSDETAIEAEIGEDEVRVPVTEEEVVEEDVRREEVDIEDQTERRNR